MPFVDFAVNDLLIVIGGVGDVGETFYTVSRKAGSVIGTGL